MKEGRRGEGEEGGREEGREGGEGGGRNCRGGVDIERECINIRCES